MGKRELLLILAFAVAGVVAYQLTAPSRPSGSRQVTVGGVIDHLRRAVRGNRSSAEVTTTRSQPLDATVTDLRLQLRSATVTVEGEDRADVAVEMRAWSDGFDDAEAQRLAKATVLKLDAAGSTLNAEITFPEPGAQRATVTLKVPSRLRIRIDSSGAATMKNVGAVELNAVRGRVLISKVTGAVSGTHRGGELTLNEIGTAKLSTQSSEVKITGVKELTMTVRGGELIVEQVGSVVELEANQADVKLDKLGELSAPLRVNANGGTVTIKGLRSEARIDGRNTEIDVALGRDAPVAIYNEGEDDVAFTPPAGGYKLDALASHGRLTPAELFAQLGIAVTQSDAGDEARATGAVAGGGPTITLRATRGDIVLRRRSAEK